MTDSSVIRSRDRECRPQYDFYWPSSLLRSLHLSISFVLVTNVMNDSMCFQTPSDWSSFQQICPCAENHHTWHSTRVVPPATPEGHHISTLIKETNCCPHISPTCRSDNRLSSVTGRLEPSFASSPRCNCSISRY